MPKPKRFKVLKSVEESSLPAASSHEDIAPSVSPQTCSLQTPPLISQTCPSTSAIPTTSQSSDPVSSQPTHVEGSSVVRRYAGRESTHFWFVDAIGM